MISGNEEVAPTALTLVVATIIPSRIALMIMASIRLMIRQVCRAQHSVAQLTTLTMIYSQFNVRLEVVTSKNIPRGAPIKFQ